MTRPDPYSILPCMLLDPSVMRDIADALDGRFDPDTEPDPLRRDQLVAAARLRVYGERDRTGWYLVTHREGKRAGQARGDAVWSAGFVPDISTFEDAPPEADLQALVLEHLRDGLDVEPAYALAYAILYEPVRILVTEDPGSYRHGRVFDLPERLEILTSAAAFRRLAIDPGEAPILSMPLDHPLASGPAWWVP